MCQLLNPQAKNLKAGTDRLAAVVEAVLALLGPNMSRLTQPT